MRHELYYDFLVSLLSRSGGMGLHFHIEQVDLVGCHMMVPLHYDEI